MLNIVEPVSLFCKTYIGDIDRFQVLLESINEFNVDGMGLYLVVPRKDYKEFACMTWGMSFPIDIHMDEEVLEQEEDYKNSWSTQQVVKCHAYKIVDSQNFVMVDADSYFIKPFQYDDFVRHDGTPYTVCHEQKDLWQYVSWKCAQDENFKRLHQNDPEGFRTIRKRIQTIMDRDGKALDFGPGPVVWSKEVWRSWHEEWLETQGYTAADAIAAYPSEFTWYGEWLLTSKKIQLVPMEPPFKFYHHREQYEDDKQRGITEEMLSENYLGIVMQSNWNAPTKF